MKGERSAKVVSWFLDADDNLDCHQNVIITFWPINNAPQNFAGKFIPWHLH